MTANQIAYKQAKETARSNKANEEIKREELAEKKRTGKSTRFKNYTDAGKTALGVGKDIGSLIAAANDPAWYNGIPDAARDAASLSVLVPRGSSTTYMPPEAGVIVYNYVPVLPHRNEEVDSVWYRSFQSMYMDIRRANSGARNYSIANIAQWTLAAQSIITLWMEAYRAYSLVNHYSARNRYFGRALTEAVGFDPEDMETHLAEYRAFLNLTAAQIGKTVPVPQIMPWFYRSIWLASNIFSDNENIEQAHFYICRPEIYYKYGDVEIFSTAVPRYSLPYTFTVFKAKFYDLYDQLIYSEDAGTIAGDIMKAFPNNYEFKLPSVEVDPKLPIVWSELVATQMRNATVLHATGLTAAAFNITEEDNGVLVQNLDLKYRGFEAQANNTIVINNDSRALALHSNNLKPEELLEAIMLKCMYNIDTSDPTDIRLIVTDCGTEIVTDMFVGVYNTEGEEEPLDFTLEIILPLHVTTDALYSQDLRQFLLLRQFNHAPAFLDIVRVDKESRIILERDWPIGPFQWIAQFERGTFQNMMGVAVSSMLGLGK